MSERPAIPAIGVEADFVEQRLRFEIPSLMPQQIRVFDLDTGEQLTGIRSLKFSASIDEATFVEINAFPGRSKRPTGFREFVRGQDGEAIDVTCAGGE